MTGSGNFRAVKSFAFAVSNNFKERRLAEFFHAGIKFFHIVKRQRLLFKAPKLRLGVFALLKNFAGVGDGAIVVRQHNYQFGIHSAIAPS